MAAAIKAETNGRFDIQIFPNNQLGSDTDMLSQLRSGGVEFFTLSGLILSTLVPAASINGIGFAFPDYETVWKAMDGELGAYVRGEIEKADLVAMDKIWDNGFRQMTTSTQADHEPDDLQGLQDPRAGFAALDLDVQGLRRRPRLDQLHEVYSALQTKIVEGQENPLAIIATAKLYEVQKYCSLTNHMWDGFWFLANRRAWEALPAGPARHRRQEHQRRWRNERADVAKLNAALQQELAAKGLTFNQPSIAPFREKLAQGRLLRGMERQIRRRGLGSPGKVRRHTGVV